MYQHEPLTIAIIDKLFQKLAATHPAFKHAWPNQKILEETKKEWLRILIKNNINSEKLIRNGLDKLRNYGQWLCTAQDFCDLCCYEPEDIKAPPTIDAYKEACKKSHPSYGDEKNWSHVTVKNARDKTGSFELTSKAYETTFPEFERNYKAAIRMFIEKTPMDQITEDRQAAIKAQVEEKKKKCAEGFEQYNSHPSAISKIKEMLR